MSDAPGFVGCPPSGDRADAVLPGDDDEPRIDDRLAPPETRLEYIDGAEVFAAPADPPHATQQSQIDRVVGSHLVAGYVPAVEMLTRTSEDSDFAPDFSVFPAAPDPATGGRQLEEIAFEVVSEQALRVATTKARKLAARGVRRVFAVDVKQRRVLEWSRETDAWSILPEGAVIEDACLVRPLPVAELLDAARADDAIARALLVKQPPALVEALGEAARETALASGREAVLDVLAERGLDVPDHVRAAIERSTDVEQLRLWHRRAVHAKTAADVLG